MDYFETAREALETSFAVRDAQVTNLARQCMQDEGMRTDTIVDVIDSHDKSELAGMIHDLVFGTPSVKADARRAILVAIENAAVAWARSQQ